MHEERVRTGGTEHPLHLGRVGRTVGSERDCAPTTTRTEQRDLQVTPAIGSWEPRG